MLLNPMTYPEMAFILKNKDFHILSLHTNRFVKRWKYLHGFLKPIIVKKTKEKFPKESLLISREILEGEIPIIYAQNLRE